MRTRRQRVLRGLFVLVAAALVAWAGAVWLRPRVPPVSAAGARADFADLRYGPEKRNSVTLWLPNAPRPAPLVLYFHGGGFISEEKSGIYGSREIDDFLGEGVAFATVGYRYRKASDGGVRRSLRDAARAVQSFRANAAQLGIDPDRIGAYGYSAGGGISVWLGVHDDMADPASSDPVCRQSTRLQAVAMVSGQSTYDVHQWPAILGTELSSLEKWMARGFIGLPSGEDVESAPAREARAEADMLAMLTQDDPPMFLRSDEPGTVPPSDRAHAYHHPLHVAALRNRAAEAGVETEAYAPALGLEPPADQRETLVEFMARRLHAP